MNKFISALILIILLLNISMVSAIEPKTGEDDEDTELSPIEKKIWEIFEKIKEDESKENELINEIVKLGEQVVPILTLELYNSDLDIAVISARVLEQMYEEKALSKIVKAYSKHILKDEYFEMGWLIQKYNDKAFPYLKQELQTQNEEVRYDYISLIGFIDTDEAITFLKEWFKEEKSNSIKMRIIEFAYFREKDDEAKKEYLEFMCKVLYEKNVEAKCAAIKTIGNIKEDSLTSSLMQLAYDEEMSVRSAVMKALRKIGTKEAIDVLIQNLKHKCAKTRAVAADELSNVIVDDIEIKMDIIMALISALSDEDSYVRFCAIVSLSIYENVNALPHLERLAQTDPDEENRTAAKEAVESIKDNIETYDDEEESDSEDD